MTQNWYAAYTAPRAEKKISEKLTAAQIEHYLPLQTVVRQWSDRKKKVTIPVIHGYIFVHITPAQIDSVKRIYGIAALVYEAGQPAIIKEKEIERLKFMVNNSDDELEFTPGDIEVGEAVIINRGNLKGLIGELVQHKGKYKVVVRIDQIGCALVDIAMNSVEKIQK